MPSREKRHAHSIYLRLVRQAEQLAAQEGRKFVILPDVRDHYRLAAADDVDYRTRQSVVRWINPRMNSRSKPNRTNPRTNPNKSQERVGNVTTNEGRDSG